jgi:hypothetical protein
LDAKVRRYSLVNLQNESTGKQKLFF